MQESLPGDGHLVVGADLIDASAIRRMVDEVAEAFGGIDVLVNNAGIFEPHPITDTSYFEWQESWRRTLGVNLVGAANVTWCVVQHMGARRADRQRRLARSVSRRARSARLRRQQGRPDRVRAVAGARARAAAGSRSPRSRPASPRPTWPRAELAGERGERRRAESPLGRVATPEEIAAAVLYLASPEAELASGAVLDVNGASYLRM